MIWSPIVAFIFNLIAGAPAFAGDSDGIKLEVGIGRPNLTITNPDASKANYTGLGGYAKGILPIVGSGRFHIDFTGSLRYLDFANTANAEQSEYAQYLGPGAGLEITYGNIFLGADYFLMRARHNSVGSFSQRVEFDIQGLNYFLGLKFHIGAGSIGFGYSQMESTVPADAVGLSAGSKWQNQALWLRFTYDLRMSVGDFFGSIFGR